MNNVSNLLRYDVNNIQYKYRLTNATISAQQNFPTHVADLGQSKLSIHTEHPQIRQDSAAFFESIGLHKMSDLMNNAAEKGRQAVLEATANYCKVANQMADIDKGVTPAQIYHQKFLEQDKTSLVVKSAEHINISFAPGGVSLEYTPSSLTMDWNVDRAIRRYAPANFRMDFYQNPKIDFIYQGGFQYVPESAASSFNRIV